MRLKAGTTIGTFTGVEKKQVEGLQPLITDKERTSPVTSMTEGNRVPEHLVKLYEAAKSGCEEPADYQTAAKITEIVTGSVPTRKRIPTTEWVSRRTKDEVERAVRDGQGCKLCDFTTSRRRIRIHIRQHFCLHYCHCGFQHVSRDQVAEHQRQTRRSDHARSRCQIHMVAEEQFSAFKKEMGWPAKRTFGPLLPTVENRH